MPRTREQLQQAAEAAERWLDSLDPSAIASPDADARRMPEAGEGEAIRDLFSPPIARIGEYRVKDVLTCAYTFTADERFFAREIGRAIVVSACSGHGYKFGAAIGRRVADSVESGDVEALGKWLRAEIA